MTEKEKIDIGIDKHKILQDIKEKESQQPVDLLKVVNVKQIKEEKKTEKPWLFTEKLNSICPVITILIALIWLAIFFSTQSILALIFSLSLFLMQTVFLVLDLFPAKKNPPEAKQKTT